MRDPQELALNFLGNLNFNQIASQWKRERTPFPHVVIDHFLQPTVARHCQEEFLAYLGANKGSFVKYEQKWEHLKFTLNAAEKMPAGLAAAIHYFNSPDFLQFLEQVTGIDGLMPDPKLWGGGLHSTFRGGKLNVHQDFTVLPTSYGQPKELQRVLNLIVYLVDQRWQSAWGGQLELWDADMKARSKSVDPIFNRAIIFETYGSNHGQPDPYLGPEDCPRISLATYYYREVQPGQIPHRSTLYQIRPGETETEDEKKARLERASEKRYSKSVV